MNYVFMTDSDSDLPLVWQQKYDIPYVQMPYALDGREYYDDLGQTIDSKTYFDRMRGGAVPVTSALNEAAYTEIFEPILAGGQDLLFIAFSSKMSCTIQAVYAVQKELLGKYPERRFRVVDTLSISMPMTLLVMRAHKMYREGRDMEEIAQWVEANRLRAQAWLCVDDLKYLKRGGRIKPVDAALGTMLDLKPIIILNRDGNMSAVDKVRGRRKAITYVAEKSLENIEDPAEADAVIVHADAEKDAEALRALVLSRMPALGEVPIFSVGPVIGAHCGPGTLALAFIGRERPQ